MYLLPLADAQVLSALVDLVVEAGAAREIAHVLLQVGVFQGAPDVAVAVVAERV
jgi:hypothetical protein